MEIPKNRLISGNAPRVNGLFSSSRGDFFRAKKNRSNYGRVKVFRYLCVPKPILLKRFGIHIKGGTN